MWVDEFEEDLTQLKGYRATPNMFDEVQIHAYGDIYDLSELGQTIVRGENNLLISVYDDQLKEAVMKSMIVHDPELEGSIEGKYISVKMGMTRSENRDSIVAKAKQNFLSFKGNLAKERAQALSTIKQLEKIIDMDEIDIKKTELEDSYKKYQKKGQKVLDDKIADIQKK